MGKRKTPVFRKGTAEQDPSKGDKIKAIRTWDDIEHDSEDDCKERKLIKSKQFNLTLSCIVHDERGKILLDGQEEVEEEGNNRKKVLITIIF